MPEWLTYAQAGDRFGTSAEAVRLRSRRFGWRTQPGNDGRTLVQVPDDAAVQPRPRPDGRSPGQPPVQAAEIARLTDLLTAAERRADRAEKQVDQAEQRADRAEKLADAADMDRRAAEARADAATADRRAAETRADRAEQGRDAERARADELRDRLDDLQRRLAAAEAEGNELTVETAELTAQLKQARAEAQEAAEAAADLRQARRRVEGEGPLGTAPGGMAGRLERNWHPVCRRGCASRVRGQSRPLVSN